MDRLQLKLTSFQFILLTVVVSSGCMIRSTPPGPNSASGSVAGVSYSFHQWAQGLSVMIWHDLDGGGSCGGSGSTSDPIYRVTCTAEDRNGRSLEWQIHTTDGMDAEMWINGDEYYLADGKLFLIDYQDGAVHIVQFQRDLSNLMANHESITAFIPTDQDVSNFVESVRSSKSAE